MTGRLVKNGREGGGRRLRVVLSEAQRGRGDADLGGVTVAGVQAGHDAVGAGGVSQPDQGLPARGLDPGDQRVLGGQQVGQRHGGEEGEGVGVVAAGQVELAADDAEQDSGGPGDVGAQGVLGPAEP